MDTHESYTQKRVLIIFTGGTIAGNVAESKVNESVKSDPENFLTIVGNSVQILKKNWRIEIKPDIVELFNVDSSNIVPEHWTTLAEKIKESYGQLRCFPHTARHKYNGIYVCCSIFRA